MTWSGDQLPLIEEGGMLLELYNAGISLWRGIGG